MTDERLQAGRHHLRNGHRAVQLGYADQARAYFESALLQFRGPALRLGEAHARRGLAEVELASGHPDQAERCARASIEGFQELRMLLDEVDDDRAVAEFRVDAIQGESAARVVLAEVLTRTGRLSAARAALDLALEHLDTSEKGPVAGTVWTALGRLALRSGNSAEAAQWFTRALEHHRSADDVEGQIAALLLLSEQARIDEDLDAAERALTEARELSRKLDHERWEGRILIGLGAVCHQASRFPEARSYYEDAVAAARTAGDLARQASALIGLGAALGRLQEPDALTTLLQGARMLASVEHTPSLASALYQIGSHARSLRAPVVALAACEGARRLWASTDGLRGQSLALRHIVKALAALRSGRGALAAALAREKLSDPNHVNAAEVATWFRERAPADVLESLNDLTLEELIAEVRLEVAAVLRPVLEPLSGQVDDLGVPSLVVDLVQKLVAEYVGDAPSSASVAVDLSAPTASSEAVTPPPPEPLHRRPEPSPSPAPGRADEAYAALFGDDPDA